MNTEKKIFKIHADYRKNNPHINWYYIYAHTKKEAREQFKKTISWLDIYRVEECTEEESKTIIENPEKHILFYIKDKFYRSFYRKKRGCGNEPFL